VGRVTALTAPGRVTAVAWGRWDWGRWDWDRLGWGLTAAGKAHRTAIAVVFAVLVIAGCGHPGPVPPAVTLSFCGNGPQPAPAVVEVICNTDDLTARNLVWTGWGTPTAAAAGTAVVDLCAYEDCHTGAFSSVPVRLVASRLAACTGGQRAYRMLRYLFPGGSPWGTLPAGFGTSSYIAAPGRTLPPRNQTVTLTCG
jgi:hypothetical protein